MTQGVREATPVQMLQKARSENESLLKLMYTQIDTNIPETLLLLNIIRHLTNSIKNLNN